MEGIVAIVFIFGGPPLTFLVWRWLKYRHDQRMRELDADGSGGGSPGEVKALIAAKHELEERVRNLETIVCNVDFELNAKLNRVASRQLALAPARADTRPPAPGALSFAETEEVTAGTISEGKTLASRYVIERLLGQGGMGAVYLAHDEQLGERIALKVIGGLFALDPRAADRLRREASAARRISHANVVRLHDIGESDGLLFLSMEYVPGGSLSETLARYGVLSPTQVRPLVTQITAGLDAAHAAGVIHRDLKPGNLLFDEHGEIKIIDFGLARLAHLEGMTATNMIVGTVEYMAPEQIRGGSVDPRTDVYALGALVYHLLTGRPPFPRETPIAVGFAHCSEPVIPPSVARPGLGTGWDPLVLRALAKDPAQRFQSATEIRQAIPADG